MLRAADQHPALAKPGGAIAFRQAIKGDHQYIVRQGAHRLVNHIVVKNFVVNFIGKNNQLVLAGNLDDFQQKLAAIHGTGGIVGVDQHYAFGTRADLSLDII